MRSDEARSERATSDRKVSREFVQAHRKTPPLGTGQVDLHDDGRGPGEALTHTEQSVRNEHPCPARRPHEQERNGHREEPAGYEHVFTAKAIGKPASEIVRERLRYAEDNDEGKDGAS